MRVSKCMRTDMVYVSVPGSREDVLHLMAEKQLDSIPVVKKGTRNLVGMVTRFDLLRKADEDQLAMLMNRNPTTVTEDDELATVAKKMVETGNRVVPVVDAQHDLVGLVSVLDVLDAALKDSKGLEEENISGFVRRKVSAVWDQTPLPLAYMIMEMAGENALVVLNSRGGVTGVISVSDFIKMSEESTEDKVMVTHSETESSVEWGWTSKDFLVVTSKLLKLPDVPVERIVTRNVITVTEVTSVSECVRTLRKSDIDQAPVLSYAGSLIGMIEDMDLLPILFREDKPQ